MPAFCRSHAHQGVGTSWQPDGLATVATGFILTPFLATFTVRVAILAAGLNAVAILDRIALAAEPIPPLEQQAFSIDSASGLLAARQPQKFLGARSCAASACHGSIDPDPRFPLSRRNEYVRWLDKDPHARSYQTLQNDLSRAILERLSHSTDDKTSSANRLANCFGCHNPQPDHS